MHVNIYDKDERIGTKENVQIPHRHKKADFCVNYAVDEWLWLDISRLL